MATAVFLAFSIFSRKSFTGLKKNSVPILKRVRNFFFSRVRRSVRAVCVDDVVKVLMLFDAVDGFGMLEGVAEQGVLTKIEI